ncbi:hypothetical protein D3C86_1079290 [compost metagenome]
MAKSPCAIPEVDKTTEKRTAPPEVEYLNLSLLGVVPRLMIGEIIISLFSPCLSPALSLILSNDPVHLLPSLLISKGIQHGTGLAALAPVNGSTYGVLNKH